MKIVKPGFQIETPLMHFSGMLRRLDLAARTAYKSEDKITNENVGKVVKHCIDRGHESVIEHEFVSVRIVCDRGVSHEIVRHRLASYTQESTRYCDYKKSGCIVFIQPPELEGRSLKLWMESVSHAEIAYNEMRLMGISPQIARSVLPNSLKTEIVMTFLS